MSITVGNIPIAKAASTGTPAKQTFEDSGISVDGSGNAVFPGYATASTISMPNLLINSDGSNPLDQAGTLPATSVTNGTYFMDGFFIFHNITQADVAVQSGGGLRLTATDATGGAYLEAYQKVETFADYAGETITLSAKVKSNTSNARIRLYDGVTFTNSSNHSGGGGFEVLTLTKTLSGSPTSLQAAVSIDTSAATGNYVEFEWIKLEVSSGATKWVRDLASVNLAKCQRYYQRLTNPTAKGRIDSATTGARFSAPLAVKMRTAPTASIQGTISVWDGTTTSSFSGIASSTNTEDSWELDFSGATGLSTGTGHLINLASGGSLSFDARL